MIDAGLVVARLLHYLAVTTLAGTSFFPLYAYRRESGPRPITLDRTLQGVLFIAANVALVSGILWFVFAVANMTGTLDGVLDREVLSTVLGNTSFGKIWSARLVLTVGIVVVIWNRFDSQSGPRSSVIVPILTAALLISLAGVGHSQVEEGIAGAVHLVSDAGHLLAAGAWLGGLIPLVLILSADSRDHEASAVADLDQVLIRFSGMGYVAVVTLIGSGLVNSWLLVGSVSGLVKTPYGQILIWKLALFAAMLALAAANRFWVVPAMNKTSMGASGAPSPWLGRLRQHVLFEQFLGVTILLAVSFLGTMRPAVVQ